ncbi:hypothetical protein NDN08_001928 [Rhodosorus marinus]|uniref:EcxA zinc-binding domain-containing protein n=1 Tax=Rhodosorus marinus TaxID=101924 RepID=A0AAV8USA0_9RHOD|nr:hypothetical protein NDN08_001928 [Rhodosorus marinus]
MSDERVALSEPDSGSEDYFSRPRDLRQRSGSSSRKVGLMIFVATFVGVLCIFLLIRTVRRSKSVQTILTSAVNIESDETVNLYLDGFPVVPDSSFQKEEGLFTVYRGSGPLSNVILFEIPESQLDKPFIISAVWNRGDAEFFILNTPVSDTADSVFAFRLSDDQTAIDMYPPQYFISIENEDSPLSTAYKQGTYTGWISSFLYTPGMSDSESSYIANVSPLVSAGMLVLPEDGTMAPDSARVSAIAAFEKSVRIEMEIEYNIVDDVGSTVGRAAAGAEFTILTLPDDPMQARISDERLGYFASSHIFLDADRALHSQVDFIQRRNLQRNGGQIVYVVDSTVPGMWRSVIKEGVEEWNLAFSAIGTRSGWSKKRVIRAVLPGDSDYPENFQVGDPLFNSISWSPSLEEDFSLGPSVVDPRSGEILFSNIVLTHGLVQQMLGKKRLANGKQASLTNSASRKVQKPERPMKLTNSRRLLAELTRKSGSVDEIVLQALKYFAMHEVGHTLGLRNNLRGSANYDLDSLGKAEFVKEKGLTSSVMDYLEPIFRLKGSDQVQFFSQTLGDYDYRAIEYGYIKDSNLEMLSAIGAKAVNDGFHFATDEDLSSTYLDPNVGMFDFSSSPMDYNLELLELYRSIVPKLKESAKKSNIPWFDFAEEMDTVLGMATQQLVLLTRYLGGFEMTRQRAGTSDKKPNLVVDSALTNRAFTAIRTALDPKDGILGFSLLQPHLGVLVQRVGKGCYEPEGVCLGQAGVDLPEMIRSHREEVLLSIVTPGRLAAINYASARTAGKSPSASEVLVKLMETLITDEIGENPVANDAAAHWTELLLGLVDPEDEGEGLDPPDLLSQAVINGALAATHQKLLERRKNTKYEEAQNILWALAWRTKSFALHDADGNTVNITL